MRGMQTPGGGWAALSPVTLTSKAFCTTRWPVELWRMIMQEGRGRTICRGLPRRCFVQTNWTPSLCCAKCPFQKCSRTSRSKPCSRLLQWTRHHLSLLWRVPGITWRTRLSRVTLVTSAGEERKLGWWGVRLFVTRPWRWCLPTSSVKHTENLSPTAWCVIFVRTALMAVTKYFVLTLSVTDTVISVIWDRLDQL